MFSFRNILSIEQKSRLEQTIIDLQPVVRVSSIEVYGSLGTGTENLCIFQIVGEYNSISILSGNKYSLSSRCIVHNLR